ncbi:indolepyruvate ferredoxin oxidoreductase alpha subunit [Caminicella sporogenes DSM 14501]|uniref:Indolepyruvate oxidoreductase subunit IorA n=1 Tax=Caminicella sporogenes DSM 14501 TaxID=1121266 RepID=A0A1M6R1X6_9FIRM|nr:indolepyruvate ferredoxin oxidoreductase subunit alpha [Caminicella sporogenes]RKD27281.1 indolepyruvate ferredoxin oxidoreductase subunit alpha [Caminicella sporogenes]SHK26357.1 indolepyruvate ferredoxin oxidoreductase alpha subunit [Caminicella sporogenes DSM 14501]
MKKFLTGNEAVARGAYEAGVTFASAYPGTPSTEILENIGPYKGEIYAEWAPNEKVALEVAIGASIAGARALAAMKHVGVNVAADPLFTYAYTGVNGGLILVSADDPGMHSSQNEQDNRNYAKFAKIAMVEPSDSQESKDFVKIALEISEKFNTPVLFRMTTRICHSKGIVELGEREEVAIKKYEKNIPKYVATPANGRVLHVKLEERLKQLEEFSNTTELNRIEWNDKKIGIISSGVAYQYAKEVFGDKASYLKLGFTFPLPMKKIREFANQVETLYVIEELEPFIEEQIKAAGIKCIGKEVIPRVGELNPDIIAKAILGKERETIKFDESKLVGRPPTMCAGCPHRGFFYVLSKKKNIMVTGDIGCYTLGSAEPLNAMDTCICMGASISTGHGAQVVFNKHGIDKRVVAVIGDSTFFHTGVTSLLDIAYNRSNTITVILDNRITGMTGHQENPGTGYTLQGDKAPIINIPELCKAMGIKHVVTVNPLNLDEVNKALDDALALDEPSVIITRWPCVLKKPTPEDIEEFGSEKTVCVVIEDKCKSCRLCTKVGCPAIEFTDKAKINEHMCVGCEVCLQVCPFDAIEKVGE